MENKQDEWRINKMNGGLLRQMNGELNIEQTFNLKSRDQIINQALQLLRTDGQTDRQMARQIDSQIDIQIDRWLDRQIVRQIYRYCIDCGLFIFPVYPGQGAKWGN